MLTKIIAVIISQNVRQPSCCTPYHAALCYVNYYLSKTRKKELPGDPVVRMLSSNAGSVGSIPGPGTKIPYALWSKKNPPKHKQKQYCNKFTEDFKNHPLGKKIYP